MGQVEVFEFLKNKFESGDESYFSVKEVEQGLRAKGYTNGVIQTARGSLIRLEASKFLETKMTNDVTNWKRLFRIRKESLKHMDK